MMALVRVYTKKVKPPTHQRCCEALSVGQGHALMGSGPARTSRTALHLTSFVCPKDKYEEVTVRSSSHLATFACVHTLH